MMVVNYVINNRLNEIIFSNIKLYYIYIYIYALWECNTLQSIYTFQIFYSVSCHIFYITTGLQRTTGSTVQNKLK